MNCYICIITLTLTLNFTLHWNHYVTRHLGTASQNILKLKLLLRDKLQSSHDLLSSVVDYYLIKAR